MDLVTDKLQFIIHSLGKKCYVTSVPTQTLSNVRQLIREEWDNDQHPPSFHFEVNELLISTKQEAQWTVGQIFERGWSVKLVERPEREVAVAGIPETAARKKRRALAISSEVPNNKVTDRGEADHEDMGSRLPLKIHGEIHRLEHRPTFTTKWLGNEWKAGTCKYQKTFCTTPGCKFRCRTYCSCDKAVTMCNQCFGGHIAQAKETLFGGNSEELE
jgi:hypothetical protein